MKDNKSTTTKPKAKPKTATGGSGRKPPKRPPTKTGGSGDRDKDSNWDRPYEGKKRNVYSSWPDSRPEDDYMRYNRGNKDKK